MLLFIIVIAPVVFALLIIILRTSAHNAQALPAMRQHEEVPPVAPPIRREENPLSPNPVISEEERKFTWLNALVFHPDGYIEFVRDFPRTMFQHGIECYLGKGSFEKILARHVDSSFDSENFSAYVNSAGKCARLVRNEYAYNHSNGGRLLYGPIIVFGSQNSVDVPVSGRSALLPAELKRHIPSPRRRIPQPLQQVLRGVLHANLFSTWQRDLSSWELHHKGQEANALRKQFARYALTNAVDADYFMGVSGHYAKDTVDVQAWFTAIYTKRYGYTPEIRDFE